MDNHEKLEIIAQVTSSKTFSRAPSSCVLLRFLTEATIDGRDLKETTIGMELYGKSYEDEKSAAHIRVNVYHLRKKLEKYYQEEGADDQWQVRIKKGQYQVDFIKSREDEPATNRTKYGIALAGFILLLAVGFWLISRKSYTPLWQAYFESGKGTTLFIGDFFGIMGTTATGEIGWNRDYNINNIEDYYRYLEEHPEKKGEINPANYPYVTGMAANGTMNISRLFHRQDKDFDILFSSQTTIKDITETNSIYIGPIKNGNSFIDFFNDANPHASINHGMLDFQDPERNIDTLVNLSVDDGQIYEHAVVSRYKGPNETEQFVFFSDHDIGVKATTEKFTDIEWLENDFKRLLNNSNYFTAIFLVKGKDRTSMELELLLWDVLDDR
ncbi:helix-turn-helix domain-containing protein [Echinicola strongylocentroti]|uniref:Helix-turn-helix domain-containing protein n=1 Tax=Echinicola strongylocentroti TaxID=1795355 RepID=A0A2Z4IGV1_9BACT|nr:helix-turn-helix domain-containing protein [Echinicola strongylocentroti]AWW30214.1 helix-turn-helix domain-containing protein [Echinicola strongylocentroti]